MERYVGSLCVCMWFLCAYEFMLNVRARVCVCARMRWGKSSYGFLLTHKKGGSEVERTGRLHSASPPKCRRVSVGLRPPAGASACSGRGQRRLDEARIDLLSPSPGGLEDAPAGRLRKPHSQQINTCLLAETGLIWQIKIVSTS